MVFFESLRTEVMNQGVHVMVVAPGFTASNIRNSALTAHGEIQGESPRDEAKMMTAEQVAEEILNATLKRKRICTHYARQTCGLSEQMDPRLYGRPRLSGNG